MDWTSLFWHSVTYFIIYGTLLFTVNGYFHSRRKIHQRKLYDRVIDPLREQCHEYEETIEELREDCKEANEIVREYRKLCGDYRRKVLLVESDLTRERRIHQERREVLASRFDHIRKLEVEIEYLKKQVASQQQTRVNKSDSSAV